MLEYQGLTFFQACEVPILTNSFYQGFLISMFSLNNFLPSDLYFYCKQNIANKIDFSVQISLREILESVNGE